MRTLPKKAIIYDASCPMCAMYTNGFVKWGLLEEGNRIPFSELNQSNLINQLDMQRARHEIPLVDLQGKATLYGLDALLCLLDQKLPWLVKIARIKPIYWFFLHLYHLVSYNRRVIVPASMPADTLTFDCTPDFNGKYRTAFIGFAYVAAILITYIFGHTIGNYLTINNGGYKMLLIAGSGWLIQTMAALLFARKKTDYVGHLSVMMLIGVLVLLPGICLSVLTQYNYPGIPIASVMLSSLIMFWQHHRRIRYLQISQWWTAGWFILLQGTAAFWIYFFYFNN
jgi:predicted DCC family thiol-disulfide oxidoreductase YuxK